MIVRTRKESGQYAIMAKAIFENSEITSKAKGLYAYLMTLPDDWKVIKSELPNRFKDGKASIWAAFAELEAAGYICKRWHGDDGKALMKEGKPYCEYVVHEVAKTPTSENRIYGTSPTSDLRSSEKRSSENRKLLINHKSTNKPSIPINHKSDTGNREPKTPETELPLGMESHPPLPPKDAQECYTTYEGKKLTGEPLAEFKRFWKAFAYKKGKSKAADAWLSKWAKFIKPDLEAVIRGAEAAANHRPKILAANKTPIMAQGWINQRRWEDEDNNPAPTAKRHRDDPNAKAHWDYTYNACRRCGETEDSARQQADEQVDRYVQGDIGPISSRAKSA